MKIFTTRVSDITPISGNHVDIVLRLNILNSEFVKNVSRNVSILTHPSCGFNKENPRQMSMKILLVPLLLSLNK